MDNKPVRFKTDGITRVVKASAWSRECTTDNFSLEPVGRFPVIMEDEPPIHLLVSDYKTFFEKFRGEKLQCITPILEKYMRQTGKIGRCGCGCRFRRTTGYAFNYSFDCQCFD